MVKVNLLPPEKRTKKQIIKENIIAIILSIVALVIITVFSLFLLIFENSLQERIKSVSLDIEKQKEENNKYKEVENIVSNLNKNIERIKNFQKQNPKWSEILNEIRNRMPSNITLEDIGVSSQSSASGQNKEKNKEIVMITIKGLSVDQYSIMKFREALVGFSLFDYVDFESSSWQQEKSKYEFIIKIKLR